MEKPFENKKIFFIDDDLASFNIVSYLLRQVGAVVIENPYTIGTINYMETVLPIHLILLDLHLRLDISGYDIFDQIRNVPRLSSIPIICITASDPETEIPKARQKGFIGFIHKPINRVLFFDQLYICMNGGQVWDTS